MTRTIRFNAFESNCVGHQSPGLWRHPRDRSWDYKDLDYWTDLAALLESGFFNSIFVADIVGYNDVYRGGLADALREGVQIPMNDPLQLINPMAMATQHIGIGITASTNFEHPYTFARRLSTADHHTKGRVAWNIVTSYLESGARNTGQGTLTTHDDRYTRAEEYLDVVYKLLEGSWEDGAVLRDRESGIFANPAKIHEIGHKGKYFDVPGYHLCEPSPQRTPVLFQAGASGAGKAFAAGHAESVFIAAPIKEAIGAYVRDIRGAAAVRGRNPRDVKIYAMATIIVDETDAKARAKYEDYTKYASYDGALVLMSAWTGIDFSHYRPTDTVKKVKTNAITSFVERLSDDSHVWTIGELAKWGGIGGIGPLFVGSPSTIADLLQEWVEETDIDGFNLAYALAHETFANVVGYVVPELQKRGVYPTGYAEGTLREKLFGAGPFLPETHPAHRFRDIERVKREEAQLRERTLKLEAFR